MSRKRRTLLIFLFLFSFNNILWLHVDTKGREIKILLKKGVISTKPGAFRDLFLEKLLDPLEFGIQVVKKMEQNGLQGHWFSRRAPLVLPMMADKQMFQLDGKVIWKVWELTDLILKPFDSEEDVPQQSSFIRIVEGSLVRELIHFAEVVKNRCRDQ